MKRCWNRVNIILIGLFFSTSAPAATLVESQIERYQNEGAGQVDRDTGKKLWYSKAAGRSCGSCHGATPLDTGRHAKTGKLIEPMALSANPERYQDPEKVEKWFLRNCKWTYGRACSAQEKANILSWLQSQ